MITYSTNWMGPINEEWLEKHGSGWSAGRIDIRGTENPFGEEIALAPMTHKDWEQFSEWLENFRTTRVFSFGEILEAYYQAGYPVITWCYEDADSLL